MKTILVPFDFSKPAVNAYQLALNIASKSKGIVYVLNVIELPVLHDTLLMPVLSFEAALLNELKQKAENEFDLIKAKFKTEIAVVFEVQYGSVFRTIIDHIHKKSIDLVLMGSHGADGLREVFIGSNAEKIVRTSPVPVLVLKDYFNGPIKNIVFPNTLETAHQEDLIAKVKALQDFFKARLHIVWVNTPLNFTSDTLTYKRLEEFARRFLIQNFTLNIFSHPNAEEGILQFSKMIKGDLIALGTNSRKGIAHLVNGSIAEDIVNHSDSLVWTYSLKNELELSHGA